MTFTYKQDLILFTKKKQDIIIYFYNVRIVYMQYINANVIFLLGRTRLSNSKIIGPILTKAKNARPQSAQPIKYGHKLAQT